MDTKAPRKGLKRGAYTLINANTKNVLKNNSAFFRWLFSVIEKQKKKPPTTEQKLIQELKQLIKEIEK